MANLEKSYFLGGLLGGLIGFGIGVFISKLILIDLLPLYFKDFADLKEVILIIFSSYISQFVQHKTKFWLLNLIPAFITNFFSGIANKIKVKLFFAFKVNKIPIYIKVLGVLIPLILIVICSIIGKKIGGYIQSIIRP